LKKTLVQQRKEAKDKGKAIIDVEQLEEKIQVQPRRPTTRAMAKKGQ